MSATPLPKPESRPPRKRRVFRWLVRVIVGLPLLSMMLVIILVRSPLVGRAVGSAVLGLTGGEWRAKRAVIAANGQLIIEDFALRAPGIGGEAGLVLSGPKAIADVDWSGLPVLRWFFAGTSSSAPMGAGGPKVRAIRLNNPLFRLSQSIDDDTLNIGGFKSSGAGGQAAAELPRLDVVDGRIEFVEHSARTQGYTVLNTIPVTGSLVPAGTGPAARSVYVLRLQETGRAAPPRAEAGEEEGADRKTLIIDGRIDLATNETSLRLYNLTLDAWPADSVPKFMRDIWRRLNVQGRVSQASFRFGPEVGVEAEVAVTDISMVALIPARRPEEPEAFLTLRRVNGRISVSASGLHADLNGLIEDQTVPSRVVLETYGTDLNCPLRCEISGDHINISRHPAFLPYVPPTVKQYLEWFGGPTADVSARVVITRGDPVDGVAAPFDVRDGRLEFRNGAAAFHKFPYRFHNMSGEVSFDSDSVVIRRIKGDGPTGARLTASGRISPLGDEAAVDLVIGVKGAPVDQHMLDAMQPGYRRMLEVLFSRDGYERLLGDGLVRTKGSPGGPGKRSPEFAFGGVADVGIKVGCPRGRNTPWYTNIDVEFAEAGLVPEPFPYPIVARDVHLFIDDKQATFTRGRFAGLKGGTAELEAKVVFGDRADDPSSPEVRIFARDVPIDDLLLSAVPGEGEDSAESGALSAEAVLSRLELEGRVDCLVRIDPPSPERAGSGRIASSFVGPILLPDVDWSLEVVLDKVMARPKVGGESGGLCLRELSGSLHVTSEQVRIGNMAAAIGRMGTDDAGSMADSAPAGRLWLGLDADLRSPELRAEPGSAQIRARVVVSGLDLADGFESAIAVFDEGAAERLSAVRAESSPAGVVDVDAFLQLMPGGTKTVEIEGSSDSRVDFRALGGTLRAERPSGRVTLRSSGEGHGRSEGLTFGLEGVIANIAFEDDRTCAVRADGELRAEGDSVTPIDLRIIVRGARFEDQIVRTIAGRIGGDGARDELDSLGLRGGFDAGVVAVAGRADSPKSYKGWIEPRGLGFRLRGEPYQFESVAGRVTFAAADGSASGRVEGGRVEASGWSAAGEADWSYVRSEGLSLAAGLRAEANGIPDSLLRILPQKARDAVESASLRAAGRVGLSDARLDARWPPHGEPIVGFRGEIGFVRAATDFGLEMTDASGKARVVISPATDAPEAEAARLSISLDRAVLESITMTGADATLVWTQSGDLIADGMSARVHGGRVVSNLRVRPGETPDTGKDVTVDLAISNVHFAPLKGELSRVKALAAAVQMDPDAEEQPRPAPPVSVGAPDASRGLIDARLSMNFTPGVPSSRMGRGSVRIAQGDVLNMPVILPLVRLSNLMLPFGEPTTTLYSTFYVDGPVAVFDDVTLRAGSVAIVGGGTLTWPGLELDMTFNSRSMQRIPVWSDLFETLRNEVLTTRVTGRVGAPVVKSETLSGTRRMLDEAVKPRSLRAVVESTPVETASPSFSPLQAHER
ncbi:MAG: hypothetical protein ACK4WH_08430 [Phycisphaerales bacterium]